MFRNESTDVIRKAKAKAAPKSGLAPPGSKHSTPPPALPPSEQDIDNSLILVRRDDTPTLQPTISFYSMVPSIDERATGFFFTNYIVDMGGRLGYSAGYKVDDNLLLCMKAVGLAGLSRTAHAPELEREVREYKVTSRFEISV